MAKTSENSRKRYTKTVLARVTENQYDSVQQLCDKYNIGTTEVIREMLIFVINNDEFKERLRQLS